jgi:hypothetical protein
MTLEQLGEQLDRIEAKLDALLNERGSDEQGSGLVDAAQLAKLLGISRETVYEHAAELGAIEIGSGSRPRKRFDVDQARAAWTRQRPAVAALSEPPVLAEVRRRRKPDQRGDGGLLPIGPRRGA